MIDWLHHRYAADAGFMAMMTMGGRNSGKSYTMFGGNTDNYDDRGVVPRLLAELFNDNTIRAGFVKLSIYLIDGENIVDMLTTPPRVYSHPCNTFSSPTLGQVILPVQEVICMNITETMELLCKVLIAISMYTINTVNALNGFSTVVHAHWLGPSAGSAPDDSPIHDCYPTVSLGENEGDDDDDGSLATRSLVLDENGGVVRDPSVRTKWYSLIFVELASVESPAIVSTTMDRLSSFGYQYSSIRLLLDMAKKCPSSKYLNQLKCINNTLLTWLLQIFLFRVSRWVFVWDNCMTLVLLYTVLISLCLLFFLLS